MTKSYAQPREQLRAIRKKGRSERLAAPSDTREVPRASLGLPSASLEAIDRCQRVPRASPVEMCASQSDILGAVHSRALAHGLTDEQESRSVCSVIRPEASLRRDALAPQGALPAGGRSGDSRGPNLQSPAGTEDLVGVAEGRDPEHPTHHARLLKPVRDVRRERFVEPAVVAL